MNGLGFAAVRDWMEFLRYERRDDFGNPNPLARHIKRVYTEISSQPGRLLNDFRHLGFNETESGKKAFDGHMQWIAAGNGINMNYRFSQSGRTERNRQNHLYIEGRFPFANVMTHRSDHPQTDSRYASCQTDQYLPARHGDLLGERVLGQDGVAAAHDSGRHAGTFRIRRTPAITSCRACGTAPATPAIAAPRTGGSASSPTIR